MEIKSFDKNSKSFTANGVNYTVSDKISPERYKEYEKLVPKLTFGLTFQEIYGNLQKMWEYLNKQQFGNAAVICHNTMNGIVEIDNEKRIHPALMMAALVIIRDGEDARIYDESLMLQKINDWQQEGIDMMSFFDLSLNTIQGFRDTLIQYTKENLQSISQEQ